MTAQESGSSPCSGLTLLTHLESVSNCECCSNDDWPHGPTIVRPKARRASSVQKQPDSPDSPGSPGRKMWLPVHFEDMDSVFRYFFCNLSDFLFYHFSFSFNHSNNGSYIVGVKNRKIISVVLVVLVQTCLCSVGFCLKQLFKPTFFLF
jgi:hypothetical protein